MSSTDNHSISSGLSDFPLATESIRREPSYVGDPSSSILRAVMSGGLSGVAAAGNSSAAVTASLGLGSNADAGHGALSSGGGSGAGSRNQAAWLTRLGTYGAPGTTLGHNIPASSPLTQRGGLDDILPLSSLGRATSNDLFPTPPSNISPANARGNLLRPPHAKGSATSTTPATASGKIETHDHDSVTFGSNPVAKLWSSSPTGGLPGMRFTSDAPKYPASGAPQSGVSGSAFKPEKNDPNIDSKTDTTTSTIGSEVGDTLQPSLISLPSNMPALRQLNSLPGVSGGLAMASGSSGSGTAPSLGGTAGNSSTTPQPGMLSASGLHSYSPFSPTPTSGYAGALGTTTGTTATLLPRGPERQSSGSSTNPGVFSSSVMKLASALSRPTAPNAYPPANALRSQQKPVPPPPSALNSLAQTKLTDSTQTPHSTEITSTATDNLSTILSPQGQAPNQPAPTAPTTAAAIIPNAPSLPSTGSSVNSGSQPTNQPINQPVWTNPLASNIASAGPPPLSNLLQSIPNAHGALGSSTSADSLFALPSPPSTDSTNSSLTVAAVAAASASAAVMNAQNLRSGRVGSSAPAGMSAFKPNAGIAPMPQFPISQVPTASVPAPPIVSAITPASNYTPAPNYTPASTQGMTAQPLLSANQMMPNINGSIALPALNGNVAPPQYVPTPQPPSYITRPQAVIKTTRELFDVLKTNLQSPEITLRAKAVLQENMAKARNKEGNVTGAQYPPTVGFSFGNEASSSQSLLAKKRPNPAAEDTDSEGFLDDDDDDELGDEGGTDNEDDMDEEKKNRRGPAIPYSSDEKLIRILRWLQKRERINQSGKRVIYVCRKQFADNRPRVSGRFVKKTEEEQKRFLEEKARAKELKKKEKEELKRQKQLEKQKQKALTASLRKQQLNQSRNETKAGNALSMRFVGNPLAPGGMWSQANGTGSVTMRGGFGTLGGLSEEALRLIESGKFADGPTPEELEALSRQVLEHNDPQKTAAALQIRNTLAAYYANVQHTHMSQRGSGASNAGLSRHHNISSGSTRASTTTAIPFSSSHDMDTTPLDPSLQAPQLVFSPSVGPMARFNKGASSMDTGPTMEVVEEDDSTTQLQQRDLRASRRRG